VGRFFVGKGGGLKEVLYKQACSVEVCRISGRGSRDLQRYGTLGVGKVDGELYKRRWCGDGVARHSKRKCSG